MFNVIKCFFVIIRNCCEYNINLLVFLELGIGIRRKIRIFGIVGKYFIVEEFTVFLFFEKDFNFSICVV